MANRRIPYGYMLENGELTVKSKEEISVKRIFTTYLAGESYQGIADILNGDKIPFSTEAPEWNKHKVKRLLADPRYIGEKAYPAIITAETFEQVQAVVRSRQASGAPKPERPAARLVSKLYCEECGEKLRHLGCNHPKPGVIYLKCPECGRRLDLAEGTLLTEVELQKTARESGFLEAVEEKGTTAEVTRVENEFNRALEKLKDPAAVVGLVQRGIAVRCACCERRAEMKKLQVLRIDINMEEKITVHFE